MNQIFKRIISTAIAATLLTVTTFTFSSCTEVKRVSQNISQEADNFNVFRRVVVINMRSDKVIFELDGYFSIYVDKADNQLEITCETEKDNYKKHFIGLNDWVAYTVEDLSGADVDPYHYEVHYLPEGNVIDFTFKESD